METNTTKIRMNCNCGPEKKMREVWGMRTRGWATIMPIRRAHPVAQEAATL